MVTSPGFGVWLSRGMYCFTDSWRTSSCEFAVALGYSRMCWASHVCSLTMNDDAILLRCPDTFGKWGMEECRDAVNICKVYDRPCYQIDELQVEDGGRVTEVNRREWMPLRWAVSGAHPPSHVASAVLSPGPVQRSLPLKAVKITRCHGAGIGICFRVV